MAIKNKKNTKLNVITNLDKLAYKSKDSIYKSIGYFLAESRKRNDISLYILALGSKKVKINKH